MPGDYFAVFLVSCAAALLGLAVLVLLVPDMRPAQAAAVVAPPPSLGVLADARMARLLGAAGLLGLLTIGDGFVYLALQERTDLALQYFPLLFVGTGVVYLLLAVPFGHLADRVGRARLLVAGHGFLLVAYVWLAWASPRPAGRPSARAAVPGPAGCLLRRDGRRPRGFGREHRSSRVVCHRDRDRSRTTPMVTPLPVRPLLRRAFAAAALEDVEAVVAVSRSVIRSSG